MQPVGRVPNGSPALVDTHDVGDVDVGSGVSIVYDETDGRRVATDLVRLTF